MKIDRDTAIVELDASETADYLSQASYREKVNWDVAMELADEMDRTVTVFGSDGQELAFVNENGVTEMF